MAHRARGAMEAATPAPLATLALGIAGVLAVKVLGDVAGIEALGGLGSVVMYNRLNRSATFDNDTRRRIFDYVRNMPGVCIADVAIAVAVSHSTASYHLDKLIRFNLLTSTVDGNKVRFFINGGEFTEEERRVVSVLDNAETRRVLATVLKRPWCYPAELTAVLGVSSPTVNWHLERLVHAALVTENRSGRNRFLFVDKNRLVSQLTRLLEKLRPTGYDASGLEALVESAGEA